MTNSDRKPVWHKEKLQTEMNGKDNPLKPNKPTPDWYDEMNLQDWADDVAMKLLQACAKKPEILNA